MADEGIKTVVEGDVTVLVKSPNRKDLNNSQIVYNRAWRKALEDKVILRSKLNDFLPLPSWADKMPISLASVIPNQCAYTNMSVLLAIVTTIKEVECLVICAQARHQRRVLKNHFEVLRFLAH